MSQQRQFFNCYEGDFEMNKFLCLILSVVYCSISMADGIIQIVTPKGVWQLQMIDNVPGNPTPVAIDVIVHGFGPGGGGTTPLPPVTPDETDLAVVAVAAASKSLKDVKEATAIAAIIDSLAKAGVPQKDFKEALELSSKIADTALNAEGRLIAWVKAATAITSDPAKLKAGLILAWNIPASAMEAISHAAAQPEGTVITGEALDFEKIIQIIQMILTLLKSLGII